MLLAPASAPIGPALRVTRAGHAVDCGDGLRREACLRTDELQRGIADLGPWFHDLDLEGVRTAPDHPLGTFLDDLWSSIASVFPADMRGSTVLDIGCNAGFYSLKLAERGARVTGMDNDARYLAQARFAASVLGVDLALHRLDVYDVDLLGCAFDHVLFMGVFYHLRHPLYALEKVARVVGERLVFQTMVRGCPDAVEARPDYPMEERLVFEEPGFPAMYFVEHRYAGDPTNWWIPNEAAAAAMLRSAGFIIEDHAAPGLYVCRPADHPLRRAWSPA
jgi:tRNA (mo5U34)-methyltransferase